MDNINEEYAKAFLKPGNKKDMKPTPSDKLEELVKATESIEKDVKTVVKAGKATQKKLGKAKPANTTGSIVKSGMNDPKLVKKLVAGIYKLDKTISDANVKKAVSETGKRLSPMKSKIAGGGGKRGGGGGGRNNNNDPIDFDDFGHGARKSLEEVVENTLNSVLTGFLGGANAFQILTQGLVEQEYEFANGMNAILYRTKGITKDVRVLRNEFSQMGSAVESTGYDLTLFQNQLMKTTKRASKEAYNVTKTGLNFAKLIGLTEQEAVGVADTFADWGQYLDMDHRTLNQVSRNIQQVSYYSGLTGDRLLDAVKYSEQFMEKMRSTGILTAQAVGNIVNLSAELKKVGIDKEFADVLSMMSDPSEFFLSSNSAMQSMVANIASRAGLTDELTNQGIIQDTGSIKEFAKGAKEYFKDVTGFTKEEFDKLSIREKRLAQMRIKGATDGQLGVTQMIRFIDKLDETGMSFEDRMNKIDESLSKHATNEEKLAAARQKQELYLNKAFEFSNKLLDATKNANTFDEAIAQIKKELSPEQWQTQLKDLAAVAKNAGFDDAKQAKIMAGDSKSVAEAMALSAADALKQKGGEDFSGEISRAIRRNDFAGLRTVQERMDTALQEMKIKENSKAEGVMSEVALQLKILNERIRNFFAPLILATVALIGPTIALGVIMAMAVAQAYFGLKSLKGAYDLFRNAFRGSKKGSSLKSMLPKRKFGGTRKANLRNKLPTSKNKSAIKGLRDRLANKKPWRKTFTNKSSGKLFTKSSRMSGRGTGMASRIGTILQDAGTMFKNKVVGGGSWLATKFQDISKMISSGGFKDLAKKIGGQFGGMILSVGEKFIKMVIAVGSKFKKLILLLISMVGSSGLLDNFGFDGFGKKFKGKMKRFRVQGRRLGRRIGGGIRNLGRRAKGGAIDLGRRVKGGWHGFKNPNKPKFKKPMNPARKSFVKPKGKIPSKPSTGFFGGIRNKVKGLFGFAAKESPAIQAAAQTANVAKTGATAAKAGGFLSKSFKFLGKAAGKLLLPLTVGITAFESHNQAVNSTTAAQKYFGKSTKEITKGQKAAYKGANYLTGALNSLTFGLLDGILGDEGAVTKATATAGYSILSLGHSLGSSIYSLFKKEEIEHPPVNFVIKANPTPKTTEQKVVPPPPEPITVKKTINTLSAPNAKDTEGTIVKNNSVENPTSTSLTAKYNSDALKALNKPKTIDSGSTGVPKPANLGLVEKTTNPNVQKSWAWIKADNARRKADMLRKSQGLKSGEHRTFIQGESQVTPITSTPNTEEAPVIKPVNNSDVRSTLQRNRAEEKTTTNGSNVRELSTMLNINESQLQYLMLMHGDLERLISLLSPSSSLSGMTSQMGTPSTRGVSKPINSPNYHQWQFGLYHQNASTQLITDGR